jgi:hypothetical protein
VGGRRSFRHGSPCLDVAAFCVTSRVLVPRTRAVGLSGGGSGLESASSTPPPVAVPGARRRARRPRSSRVRRRAARVVGRGRGCPGTYVHAVVDSEWPQMHRWPHSDLAKGGFENELQDGRPRTVLPGIARIWASAGVANPHLRIPLPGHSLRRHPLHPPGAWQRASRAKPCQESRTALSASASPDPLLSVQGWTAWAPPDT